MQPLPSGQLRVGPPGPRRSVERRLRLRRPRWPRAPEEPPVSISPPGLSCLREENLGVQQGSTHKDERERSLPAPQMTAYREGGHCEGNRSLNADTTIDISRFLTLAAKRLDTGRLFLAVLGREDSIRKRSLSPDVVPSDRSSKRHQLAREHPDASLRRHDGNPGLRGSCLRGNDGATPSVRGTSGRARWPSWVSRRGCS